MGVTIPVPRMPQFAPPVYHCRKTDGTPPMDGDLEGGFWSQADWTADFVDIEGDIRPRPRFATRAKMLWDDRNLYIGAELEDTEIWANVTRHDDMIYQDNDFEIFIDPDSDTQCYVEYEMNARQTDWDLLLTKAYRDGGKAVSGLEIKGLRRAVHIDGELNNPLARNRRWVCEVIMPLETLRECCQDTKAPVPGDYWRVNFLRVHWKADTAGGVYRKQCDPASGRPLPEEDWAWAPIGLADIHYPELWGFVFFCDGEDSGTIPEDEYRKWELRRLYYEEYACFDRTGRFSAAVSIPGCAVEPKIQVTDHFFELSCPASDGTRRLVLLADGRTFYR